MDLMLAAYAIVCSVIVGYVLRLQFIERRLRRRAMELSSRASATSATDSRRNAA